MKYVVTSVGNPIKIRFGLLPAVTGECFTRLIGFSVLFKSALLFNIFVALLWSSPPLGWARRISVSVFFVRYCCSGSNAGDQHRHHLAPS